MLCLLLLSVGLSNLRQRKSRPAHREPVALRNFKPPVIHTHTTNSPARDRMKASIAFIQRLAASL